MEKTNVVVFKRGGPESIESFAINNQPLLVEKSYRYLVVLYLNLGLFLRTAEEML